MMRDLRAAVARQKQRRRAEAFASVAHAVNQVGEGFAQMRPAFVEIARALNDVGRALREGGTR
jgi:hypothetical protein